MNFKELTAAISEAENLPAGTVRKSCRALLERMAAAIEAGEKLNFPNIVFVPRTLSYRPAEEGKKERPERKVAQVRIKQKKEKEEDDVEVSPEI